MFTDRTLTLAQQILGIVELFLKTLGQEAHARRIGLISGAIWNRVRKLERRFLALHALWKAGRLPAPRVARAGDATGGADGTGKDLHRGERGEALSEGAAMVARPASLLPRAFGWMYRIVPMSAGTLRSMLEPLICEHPQMKVFVAECPQVGRVLRPMCRMMGLKAPDWLALPGGRRSSPRLVRSAAQSPQGGETEGPAPRRKRRTPREVAGAAIERSNRTGTPIDPRKIGAVAFGYVLHWPRDDNCPPPEIGYGGRMFPPLPKDYKRPKD